MKTVTVRSLCLIALLAAAPRPCPALTIEAPEASIKTVGGKASPAENADGGWNLFSNGEVGEFVTIPQAGTYKLVVRAGGSPARGTWPQMAVVMDGISVASVVVDKEKYADYIFPVKMSLGVHRITVAFLNDAAVPADDPSQGWKEDRNLYLRRIEIVPAAGAAAPALGSVTKWAVENQRREEEAVSATAKAIEQHRKGDAVIRVVDAAGRPVAGAKVEVSLARHDFLFGCNIYMFDYFKTSSENDLYKQRFAELFNYATVGFYWQSYEPQRGRPNYAYTDKVVAWCADRQIRMKGHPLLWAHQAGIPVWSDGQPSAEVRRQRVIDLLGRYGSRIAFWEVVNEPGHLESLPIDEPYRWARQVDPKACLIVNDSDVLSNGFPTFLKLLQEAKASGVPFDGIGIQAHEPRTMRFPLQNVVTVLDQYAALGKGLHITEFTPRSSGDPITGSHLTGPWDEKAQAEYAEKFYRVCFAHPAVVAITWWDLCDQGSWLTGGGMLRKDLSPKPVYTALHKLIHQEWTTRVSGQADANGSLRFRGFFGRYSVRVTQEGKAAAGEFLLDRKAGDQAREEWILKIVERH